MATLEPGTLRPARADARARTDTFRVASSNEAGLWRSDVAALKVTVDPLYYETDLFKLLIAAFAIAMATILVWARSTWLTLRIKERLRERSRERERIARELHDTLLQGIQGLMLHMQSVSGDLPEEARSKMGRALDRADNLMAEGRQRVNDLRLQEEGASLGTSLHRYIVEGAPLSQARIHVREMGRQRELSPAARIEVLRIGAEAALNALQHSGGRKIRIVVRYDRHALRLRISDDGCGIDQTIAASGRPGHWGVRGMRERAAAIKSKLRLARSKCGGTVVELWVPGGIAYGHRRIRWLDRVTRVFTGSKWAART